MRRKPAIIVLFLLLFLSIGGAVFYRQLQKEKASDIREVDTFFRTTNAGGWRFKIHTDDPPYTVPGPPDWWNQHGIHRNITAKNDQYIFTHERNQGTMVVVIVRHDGKFNRISFSSGPRYPEAEIFRNATFERFPRLRRYEG